jgi:type II secretory pathway component PulF
MEIQLFAFVIYLLTGSYLLWKAIAGAFYFWQAGYLWRLRRSPIGRLAIVDHPNGQTYSQPYFLQFIALVLGIGLALFSFRQFQPAHWLLLVLVIIGFGLEELRPSQKHRALPDVITVISTYRAATERGYDLPDALRFTLLRLPSGKVKDALEEVLHRQRRGMPMVQCLTPLKRCSRYLAEFVAMHEGEGSLHRGLFDLSTILRRARWEWALNHQTYLLIDKAQNYLRPLRSFVLGGLIVALWFQAPELHRTLAFIWPELFI